MSASSSTETMMQYLDAITAILDSVKGYRSMCEERGFSPSASEKMALEYHKYLLGGLAAEQAKPS